MADTHTEKPEISTGHHTQVQLLTSQPGEGPGARHMGHSLSSLPVEGRPCRTCAYWVRDVLVRESGASVVRWYSDPDTAECSYGGTISIRPQASRGCAFWVREPGADDS